MRKSEEKKKAKIFHSFPNMKTVVKMFISKVQVLSHKLLKYGRQENLFLQMFCMSPIHSFMHDT